MPERIDQSILIDYHFHMTQNPKHSVSLSDVHRSVNITKKGNFYQKLLSFIGPGFLVSVGYMDPGNWATSTAGGSAFGMKLLSVILISNIMAIFLQALCARLGIATGQDLAQACARNTKTPMRLLLWILAEIAIIATDLAEVIGTALALHLLFGISMPLGIALTALDAILVLYLQTKGFRRLEAFIISLLALIAICFAYTLFLAQPSGSAIVQGFIPSSDILTNPTMLYIAIGILGATVMPHNLYLHSAIVQTRKFDLTPEGKKSAITFATIDSTLALMLALFVNSSILILAASVFYRAGYTQVAEIQQAHELLTPLLGTQYASIAFAVALFASGLNATVTATLAGQVVMEGFLNLKLSMWVRRLVTRAIAIVPALGVALYYGDKGTADLLIASQVVLSLQLPFAIVPLMLIVGSRAIMGEFAVKLPTKLFGWAIVAIVISLNVILLKDFVIGFLQI